MMYVQFVMTFSLFKTHAAEATSVFLNFLFSNHLKSALLNSMSLI